MPIRICLCVLCAMITAHAFASGGVSGQGKRQRDRLAHIDTLYDSTGESLYRIRCTDIVVKMWSGKWMEADSVLFFSEQRKTEWASTILNKQVDMLRDSLKYLADSASSLIAHGRFTRPALDSTMLSLQELLQQTSSTHSHSLRRLEDYQAVLNAARPILRGTYKH